MVFSISSPARATSTVFFFRRILRSIFCIQFPHTRFGHTIHYLQGCLILYSMDIVKFRKGDYQKYGKHGHSTEAGSVFRPVARLPSGTLFASATAVYSQPGAYRPSRLATGFGKFQVISVYYGTPLIRPDGPKSRSPFIRVRRKCDPKCDPRPQESQYTTLQVVYCRFRRNKGLLTHFPQPS